VFSFAAGGLPRRPPDRGDDASDPNPLGLAGFGVASLGSVSTLPASGKNGPDHKQGCCGATDAADRPRWQCRWISLSMRSTCKKISEIVDLLLSTIT